MNNEPVAWMDKINTFLLDKDYKQFPKSLQNGMIPLYTHPAKELTDEEIVSLYESSYLESGLDEWEFDPVYFAKAILRKVQEKCTK